MFSHKNILDPNLRYHITNKSYSLYRVLIKCNNFIDTISKKITSYKGILLYSIKSCNIICAKLNSASILKLIEYPEVKYVCFDEYLFLCGVSVLSANKFHFKSDIHLKGNGVSVGIIDSGVFPHKDLTYPNNRIEKFVDTINNYHYPYDDNGHGTCTCGIVAGNGESSNNLYSGIAPKSKLYCYKAFDKHGKGYASDILFSLDSLINLDNINILCLPFEFLSHNIFILNLFDILFKLAVSKNITPIVPSGSNRSSEYGSLIGLSTLKNCITVAGTETNDFKLPYEYSSSGPYMKSHKIDVAAPCVNIMSLNSETSYISEKNTIKIYPPKLETSYKQFTGTSISVSFITGVCCLLYEDNPNYTFEDISSIIKLASSGDDYLKHTHGNGVVKIKNLFTFN